MRLATIRDGASTRCVITRDGEAAVVNDATGAPYADVGALLRAGKAGQNHARSAEAGSGFTAFDSAALARPVLEPGAIFCVGLNYRSHILEMGRDLPEHPTLFSKLSRSLTDPFARIDMPLVSDRIDYEGELAVVIGTGGRDIARKDAWEAVAGLTVLNDVTVRDFQKRTLQWFAGKTWEASTPFGPSVVTLDEVGDVGALELTVKVNGDERQRATIDDLVFDVPALIEDISKIVSLQPGDIIATGTPGGVGEAMDPQGYIQSGDTVEVAITGIGTISNQFVRNAN